MDKGKAEFSGQGQRLGEGWVFRVLEESQSPLGLHLGSLPFSALPCCLYPSLCLSSVPGVKEQFPGEGSTYGHPLFPPLPTLEGFYGPLSDHLATPSGFPSPPSQSTSAPGPLDSARAQVGGPPVARGPCPHTHSGC